MLGGEREQAEAGRESMVLKGQRLDVPYDSRRTHRKESELHMNKLKGKDNANSLADRLVTMNFLCFVLMLSQFLCSFLKQSIRQASLQLFLIP